MQIRGAVPPLKHIHLVIFIFLPIKNVHNFASASFTSHQFDCLLIVNKQLLGNPYDVTAGIPKSIDQLVILTRIMTYALF